MLGISTAETVLLKTLMFETLVHVQYYNFAVLRYVQMAGQYKKHPRDRFAEPLIALELQLISLSSKKFPSFNLSFFHKFWFLLNYGPKIGD